MQLILNTKDYMIIDISAELGVGFGKEGTQGRAKVDIDACAFYSSLTIAGRQPDSTYIPIDLN